MLEYVLGIDVSKWQGLIDWVAVKAAGVVWACARIGIGTTYLDPMWARNLNGAREAGIVIGGYFVPTYCGGVGGQVNNLENGLEKAALPDFLVNDVELFCNTGKANTNDVTYWVDRYMKGVVNGRVLTYTSSSKWDTNLGDRFMARDDDAIDPWASYTRLWIAHYRALAGQDWRFYLNPSNMPDLPISWTPSSTKERGPYLGWRIWQVTQSALNFPGIQSKEIDLNLWKADDFYEMFPGAQNGTGNGNGEPPNGEVSERLTTVETQLAKIDDWGNNYPGG